MPRYKLIIEYDGTLFAGWQRQDNVPSVQQALEDAVFAFCAEHVTVKGAGRTDAGVHARGQVAHIDFALSWPDKVVRNATNAHLAKAGWPVAVLEAEQVNDDFDARFSALKRHYEYRIIDRRAPLALELYRAWRVPRRLDADSMHIAAQGILGLHDFTTFRAAHCQAKNPLRTLERLDVTREGNDVVIRASARSFLHNQVRSMVGSLKMVGEGRWQPQDMRAALDARDRRACGPVAPPEGLYLMRVDYSKTHQE
jgi:tRNA pseudouridine38-40 synthase